MSNNIDQFSIYTAKIFEILYDSFPIPSAIDDREIIKNYLTFNKNKELEELKHKRECIGLFSIINDEKANAIAKEYAPIINKQYSELEHELLVEKRQQKQIFNGTLDFLCYEGLIRECDYGYQLTSKGFSHLNKSFKGGEITNENDRNISILKSVFEKSSETSLQVAAGTIVNVLTKVLGYS